VARKVILAFQSTSTISQTDGPIENLTPRELEIMELLSRGLSYKMMAADLNLGVGTIQTHIRRIYKKLHVNCRTEAVMKYVDTKGAKANALLRS
jgi:DNA-binding NarL/FixJ family response regulator